jgi:two-component system response regulator AtoC
MKILIVDDESDQRGLLKGFLEKQGYEVAGAANAEAALERFSKDPFQLVLLDQRMPGMTGDALLRELKARNPLVHAIMITAFGSVETAVGVMRLGADDFLEKPVDLAQLLEKIHRIEQAVMVSAEAMDVVAAMDAAEMPLKVIGESPAMKEILSLVRRIAPTPWTALIRGETGTGKELIARLIHLLSDRAGGPFIEVNCAAIPENLFESELFGHERGAFTGASAMRKGRFELASGGTLFLDEVGELPLNLQAKLLRALQEGHIVRVGGTGAIAVDVRVLAATNRDLRQGVAQGTFREDLFYRLNVLDLELPPLRQRRQDIPALVEYFLTRYQSRPVGFDPDTMALLVQYRFPGNVRELEHMIQRMVTLSRGPRILPRDLPAEVRFYQAADGGKLAERLDALERQMLVAALEQNDWVQTRAADSLGISERVLRYKMKKHGIGKS